MGIFQVTPIKNAAAIGKVIQDKFGRDAYVIPETSSWLIAYNGTARELSDDLNITKGGVGTGLVVSISNYYGIAPTDMWEWIKTRMERN